MVRRKPVETEPPDDSAWDASRLRAAWDRAQPLNQTQVAASVGTTVQSLRMWRRGKYEPRATQLRALARALGVDILDVLPEE